MIEECTTYKASNGKSFDIEFDAWKEELRTWLMNHGADNIAIATAIVKNIDDKRPDSLSDLSRIVAGLTFNAPPVALAPTDDIETGIN